MQERHEDRQLESLSCHAPELLSGGQAPPPANAPRKKHSALDPKTLALLMSPLPLAVRLLKYRPHAALRIRDAVTTAFHILYHTDENTTWLDTSWLGVPVKKCPLDLWIYQEIIYETKPNVIVEAGTGKGGSAYFFASLLDLMGSGRVLTIDVEDRAGKPRHERITYLRGSSTSDETIQMVRSLIREGDKAMVSLDSNHTKPHVLDELRLYGGLVTVGNYLVLEDTNLNGHPVRPNCGPGPMEALGEFLKENSSFVPDLSREKFGLTFNPRGYLKRIQ